MIQSYDGIVENKQNYIHDLAVEGASQATIDAEKDRFAECVRDLNAAIKRKPMRACRLKYRVPTILGATILYDEMFIVDNNRMVAPVKATTYPAEYPWLERYGLESFE